MGTIRWECLDKFIIFGKRHLDYVLKESGAYYNTTRSSMVRDHLPPLGKVPTETDALSMNAVRIRSHLGGLIRSFERKAA